MENPNAALFATEIAPGTAWACTIEGIAMEISVRAEGPADPPVSGLAAKTASAIARLFGQRAAPSPNWLATKD